VSAQSDSAWPGTAAIRAHVDRHIGPIDATFEVADGLSILHSAPSETRPLHTLITCGMSARPMPVPAASDAPRRLELMVTLSRDWNFGSISGGAEVTHIETSWPARLLISLAGRLDEPDRWLAWGNVVPNGDPPRPYAPTTRLCAAIIVPSLLVPVKFFELGSGSDRVAFFAAMPLYAEELELHRSQGMEALFSRLIQNDVNDVLHPRRKNAAKRFFGLF
jgi:Suppressor of fused protein (SUFU)